MSGPSPTLRQRELGTRLRKLRTGLGMTVDDVADKMLCSPAKISRIETAARRASLRDVRDLCALYGVADSVAAELMQFAREARQQGWWTQYGDLNLYPYIGLEQEASSITHYAMHYVPALLQTEEYARAIIKAVLPKIDSKVLHDRVEVRIRRQQLFDRDDPPRYRVLLDEAVLHRQVGGTALMVAQLARIIEVIKADKATVQVIPFEVGAYPAGDSMFVILEFDDSVQSPIVYVEGLFAGQYYERPPDLDQYKEAIERQRDSALSPRDSLQMLENKRKAYLAQENERSDT